ncbi:hypothetical protein ACP70R_050288 [Stipagrostis hirtigluma subsp. patula]
MEGGDLFRRIGDPLAQLPGGGSWAEDAGVWTESDLLGLQELDGHDWPDCSFDFSLLLDEPSSSGTKQAAVDSLGTSHQVVAAGSSGMGCLPPMPLASGTNQVGDASLLEQAPVGVDPPPPPLAPIIAGPNQFQLGVDSLEPAADATAAVPDEEEELARVFRAAAQCGEDDAGTVWSKGEQRELLHRLALLAKEADSAMRCFKIAYHLPKKTALDVALRCRWLQDKNKTAKQDELVPTDSAGGKVKKGKGTKGGKNNNKIYPLSKEALDSKSIKELIMDNEMFLKRIEEDLKTGQLENTADYFYYVKTNMDAIENRRSEFGFNMITLPPIDEEGLQEILQTRLSSSVALDA